MHQLHARLRPFFARPEVHQQALRYLQAVLSDVPRKNGWQLAEQARQAHPYGMQRLLSQAVWDQEAVRDELRRLVSETVRSPRSQEADEAPFPVLVLDESGFPKRGAPDPVRGRDQSGALPARPPSSRRRPSRHRVNAGT